MPHDLPSALQFVQLMVSAVRSVTQQVVLKYGRGEPCE